jgi:hypothetical protein
MKIIPVAFAALAWACSGGDMHAQPSTPEPAGHAHGGTTLFLAQIDAAHVVPPGNSAGSATGAFLVNPAKRSIDYELTFHALQRPPQRIELHNFDVGGNGALIRTICGGDAPKCPDADSASLAGTWDGRGPVALDQELLGELASGRVYVEIVGGDGKPEIRGQLEANNAMVPVKNFVAHLSAAPGADSRGVGTAVVSEVHFAGGRIAVFYRVTVAGTSGAPSSAALSPGPATDRVPERNVLPEMTISAVSGAPGGGTMTGQYEAASASREAPFATRLAATGQSVGVVVLTTKFPAGELYGVLKPVQ